MKKKKIMRIIEEWLFDDSFWLSDECIFAYASIKAV